MAEGTTQSVIRTSTFHRGISRRLRLYTTSALTYSLKYDYNRSPPNPSRSKGVKKPIPALGPAFVNHLGLTWLRFLKTSSTGYDAACRGRACLRDQFRLAFGLQRLHSRLQRTNTSFDLVNQLSSRPRRGNLVLAGSRAADLCHFTPLASEIQRGKRSKRTRVLSSLGPSGPSCFSPYLAELSSETAAMRSWTGLLCQYRYCSASISSGSETPSCLRIFSSMRFGCNMQG
jgi:hypothetical protein